MGEEVSIAKGKKKSKRGEKNRRFVNPDGGNVARKSFSPTRIATKGGTCVG